jgi:excisionase family DNA binding protein
MTNGGNVVTTSAPASPATRTLLSVPDVARELGCGRDTVYVLIGSGQLSSVRIAGRLRRIRRSDLDAYIDGLVPSRPGAHAEASLPPTGSDQ